jgi:DNA polymerase sigma
MKINCHHCNIEVEKNDGEITRSQKLGRRLFCSLSCSVKQQQKDRHARFVEAYYTNPTLCEQCNLPLPYEKRRNRFCGNSCAAVINNVLFPKREKMGLEEKRAKRINKIIIPPTIQVETKKYYCKQCNTELTKNTQTFFCSSDCSEEHSRQKQYIKIEAGENVGIRPLKRYIILKRGNKCEDCGWDKVNSVTGNCPIELEHIDGNSENNSIDNLKLLCPNCHSLTSTYKNLNKGKGRHSRRKRYAEGKSY